MSFSKENRKDVFDFFVKILCEKDEPVYYDYLRSYVSRASPVVRKYVLKECKGENLLEYFQKRKKWFVVDRKEVSLSKSFKQVASKEFFKSEITDKEMIEYEEKSEITDKEMIEYEEITKNHFIKYLSRNEKLNLSGVEFTSFPKEVQYYLTTYMKGKVILFLQTYSDIFYVDNCYVRLVTDPAMKNASVVPAVQTTEPETYPEVEEVKQSTISPNFKEQAAEDFLRCAEFFISVLKKKTTPIYVDKLSGHLSQAPKEVIAYLKHYYKSFKHFLLDAPKLFIFSRQEEVSLSANSSKLLKQVKKHYRMKSQDESFSMPISSINSVFKYPTPVKKSLFLEADETSISVPVTEKLQLANINFLNRESMDVNSDTSYPCNNTASDIHIDCKSISTLSEIQNNLPSFDMKMIDYDVCHKTQPSHSSDNYITIQNCENSNNVDNSLDPIAKLEKTRNYSKECLHTIQLMCLQKVEKELNLNLKFEYESVKYFTEILKSLPGTWSEIHTLQGHIGHAPKDIIAFMSKLYGGEKFEEFFEKHDEFVVYSKQCVLLSSKFQDNLNDRLNKQKSFKHTLTYFQNLFDSQWNNMCIDFLIGLNMIFSFLENKNKVKISRLSGRMALLPVTLQNFIKSLNAEEQGEKMKQFLEFFNFFVITNTYVSLNPEIVISSAMEDIKQHVDGFRLKALKNDYASYVSKTFNNETSFQEICNLKNRIVNCVKDYLHCTSSLNYSDLLKVLGPEVFYDFDDFNLKFFDLILILIENNLFQVENGEISLKSDVNETEIVEESKFVGAAILNLDVKSDIVLSNDNNGIKDVFENSMLEEASCREKLNQDRKVCLENNEKYCDGLLLNNGSNNFKNDELENYGTCKSLCEETVNKSKELDVEKHELGKETAANNDNCYKENVENAELETFHEDNFFNKDNEEYFVNNTVCSDEILISNNIEEKEFETSAVGKLFCDKKRNEGNELDFKNNKLSNEIAINNFMDEILVKDNFSFEEIFSKEKMNQDIELNFNYQPCSNNSETDNSKVNSHLKEEIADDKQYKVLNCENSCTNNLLTNLSPESIEDDTNFEHLYISSDDSKINNKFSQIANTDGDDISSYSTDLKKEVVDNKQYEVFTSKSSTTNNLLTNLSSKNVENDDTNIEHACSSFVDIDINNAISHYLIVNTDADETSNCSTDLKKEIMGNEQYEDLTSESNHTNYLVTNLPSENVEGDDINIEHSNTSNCSTDLKGKMAGNEQYKDLTCENISTNYLTNLSSGNSEVNDINIEHCYSSSDDSTDLTGEIENNNKQCNNLICENSFINLPNNLSSENDETYYASTKSETGDKLSISSSVAYVKESNDIIPHRLSTDHFKNNENSLNSYIGIKHFTKFVASSSLIFLYPPTPLGYVNNYDDFIQDKFSIGDLKSPGSSLKLDINDTSLFNKDSINSDSAFNFQENNVKHISALSLVTESNAKSVEEYHDDQKLRKHDKTISEEGVTSEIHTPHIKTETINMKEPQSSVLFNCSPPNETFDIYRYTSELENSDKLHCSEIENDGEKCALISAESFQDSKMNVNAFSRHIDCSQKNGVVFIESSLDHEKVEGNYVQLHPEIKNLNGSNIISDNIRNGCLQSVNTAENKSEENSEETEYSCVYNDSLNSHTNPEEANLMSLGGSISLGEYEKKISVVDKASFYSKKDVLNKSINCGLDDPIVASKISISSAVHSLSDVINNKFENTNPNKIWRTSDTASESSSSEDQYAKSIEQKHDLNKADAANHNSDSLFMQPLLAKVMLSCIDSCIVETELHGQVKLVFCLKSSFHCDQHNNCIKCFESLKIGDKVSCYISPIEKNSNYSNMYFSFMLCKESTSEIENSEDTCYFEAEKLTKRYHSSLYDFENNVNHLNSLCGSPTVKTFPDYIDYDHKHYESKSCQTNFTDAIQLHSENSYLKTCSTFSQTSQTGLNNKVQHCPSVVEKECQVTYSVKSQNCQTELSGKVKICSSRVEKGCQANYSQLTQITQTFCESVENACQTELSGRVRLSPSAVEKECQAECSVQSQMAQTVSMFTESACQTVLSGKVRLSPSLFQKECQTQLSTSSIDIQTVNENIDGESQTDVSGSIKCCFDSSSLGSQTVLSGQVKKCVSLANKSCQCFASSVLDWSSQSQNMFSIPKSDIELPSFKSPIPEFQSFESTNSDNVMGRESTSTAGRSKDLSTKACQTISTGAIIIKQYCV